MRIDAATVTATNSIRFLMKYNGNDEQELRIQNVSLKKWVKSLGSLTPTEATFDKANQSDVSVTVRFADGLSLYAVACDGKTNYVAEDKYTATTNSDGTITLTLKKEYLATLANGEHKFYVSSSENESGEYAELELTVTVSGTVPSSGDTSETTPVTPSSESSGGGDSTPTKKKGCGGSIAAVSGILGAISVGGVALVASKKRRNK